METRKPLVCWNRKTERSLENKAVTRNKYTYIRNRIVPKFYFSWRKQKKKKNWKLLFVTKSTSSNSISLSFHSIFIPHSLLKRSNLLDSFYLVPFLFKNSSRYYLYLSRLKKKRNKVYKTSQMINPLNPPDAISPNISPLRSINLQGKNISFGWIFRTKIKKRKKEKRVISMRDQRES